MFTTTWNWIKVMLLGIVSGVSKMKHRKVKRTTYPTHMGNGVDNRKPMSGYMGNPPPSSPLPQTDDVKRQFATAYVDWLKDIPESKLPWVDALMAAALDETQGNLMESLRIVKEEYAKGE